MLRQALCVCKSLSRVSRRSASRPRVTCVEVNARERERETTQAIVQQHRVVLRCACLCFWRALGQSAQAEQDTPILCRKQESVEERAGAYSHTEGVISYSQQPLCVCVSVCVCAYFFEIPIPKRLRPAEPRTLSGRCTTRNPRTRTRTRTNTTPYGTKASAAG